MHDEGRGVRGVGARDVRDQARIVRRACSLVFDVGVDRPGGVGSGQRLAVGPLRVRHRPERPRLAAVRDLPGAREERCEVKVLVVLHQHGIDVFEGAVGVLVERDVRIERIDPRAGPDPERPPALRARALPRRCVCRHRDRRDAHRGSRHPRPTHVLPPPPVASRVYRLFTGSELIRRRADRRGKAAGAGRSRPSRRPPSA